MAVLRIEVVRGSEECSPLRACDLCGVTNPRAESCRIVDQEPCISGKLSGKLRFDGISTESKSRHIVLSADFRCPCDPPYRFGIMHTSGGWNPDPSGGRHQAGLPIFVVLLRGGQFGIFVD